MHVDNSLLKSGNIMSSKEDTISSVRHTEMGNKTKPDFHGMQYYKTLIYLVFLSSKVY